MELLFAVKILLEIENWVVEVLSYAKIIQKM